MEKVYLKFRLEVLSGNYLLFQVLEQDERFKSKDFISIDGLLSIGSWDYPCLVLDKIYLRGISEDENEVIITADFGNIESANNYYTLVIKSLANFPNWEGFKSDGFNDSFIKNIGNDTWIVGGRMNVKDLEHKDHLDIISNVRQQLKDIKSKENTELKKPPLGLVPRWIRQEKFNQARATEILEAIARYRASDMYVPCEWVDELKGLICDE